MTDLSTENVSLLGKILNCYFVDSAEQGLLEESTVNVCKNFVVNNGRTGNFCSLLRVFLRRVDELGISAQCQEYVVVLWVLSICCLHMLG